MRVWFAIVVALAGCLQDHLVPCGELACGVGFVCTAGGCAAPDAAAACSGKADGDACTFGVIDGTCAGGSCHAHACGNGIVDRAYGEVCDDGNQVSGDGCSADCRSTEICGNDIVDTLKGEQCDEGIAGLSGKGCTSRCTIEFDVWRALVPPVPPGRLFGGLAPDATGHVVMVGGTQKSANASYGTWSWSGDNWERRKLVNELPARQDLGVAYDTLRLRTVIFGGTTLAGINLAETWEWDGTSWFQRNPVLSPAPRHGGRLAYDALRHQVVLFGGKRGTVVMNDTWAWDGSSWRDLTPALASQSPPARYGHTMAFDPTRGRIVMFGGMDAGANPNFIDTWAWDGTTWTQVVTATAPATGAGASLAYDAIAATLVLYTTAQETWTGFGVMGATWTKQTVAPPPLIGPSLSADPTHGQVLMFGGADAAGSLGLDTFQWTGAAWIQVGSATPVQVAGGAFDAPRGIVVGFGLDGLWEWDGAAWTQRSPTTGPAPRADTALAYDVAAEVTVMFGGESASALGDTWTWNGRTSAWTQTNSTGPPPRSRHAMAYDAARQTVVMFGGQGAGMKLGDTWEWDGANWTQDVGPGPSPRSGHGMAYDPIRNKIVLFGGDTTAETWEWDGSWTQLAPATPPPPRSGTSLAYDPLRQRVVAFGGSEPVSNDAWEWDGQTWTERAPVLVPNDRLHSGITPDVTGGLLLFAGLNNSGMTLPVGRLHFESAVVPPERCLLATEDSDGDGLFGCADPDCWERCTPLCPPGVTCDPAAPYCGDGACGAVEDYLICPVDCPLPP